MKEKLKNKIDSWTRPTRRWTDIYIIAAALSVGIIFGGEYLIYYSSYIIPYGKLFGLVTKSDAIKEFMYEYFAFLGIWIIVLLLCAIFKSNRPIIKQLAPSKKGRIIKGIVIGLVLGFALNSVCIFLSMITGNIHLSFNEFNPALFFTLLLFVAIQSSAEEILMRGYFYQKLRRRYKKPIVAIVGNALVFTAIHLANDGITVVSVLDVFASGIVFSLLVYYYDSLWAAMALHTAWNFTQNIIFGLPNSGVVSEYSLFKLDAAKSGFFYDTGFGVEGSVGSLIILVLVIVAIVLINRGKPEKNDIWYNLPPKKKKSKTKKQAS